MTDVTFDRNNPVIRAKILGRIEELAKRIHSPGSIPLNPLQELENLFDLLAGAETEMLPPEDIGSRVRVQDGSIFVKVGTDAWIKENPDTVPVFPIRWIELLNPRPVDEEIEPPLDGEL